MSAVFAGLPVDAVLPQAATPCLDKLNARDWHRTLAVRVSGWHVGVRVDTPAAAEAVDAVLGSLRVPEMDTRVGPNFSVELGGQGLHAGRRSLCLVYRDHELVGRRRDPEPLLLDLLELLDEVALLGTTEGLVVHATGALTPSGQAVLFPPRVHKGLLTRRQQLSDAGLELLRTRTQQVASAPSELVLGTVDPGLAEVMREHSDGRTRQGRFALRSWGVPALGNQAFALRRSEAVFASFALVLNRHTMGTAVTLRALSEAAVDTQFSGVPELSPAALAATLVEMAGRGDS